MSFEMTYNGTVLPIRVRSVGGRGTVYNEVTAVNVPNKDGTYVVKKRLPAKPMPVEFTLNTDGISDIRAQIDALNAVLIQGLQVEVTFSDEPGKTYFAFLDGQPDQDEMFYLAKGTLPLIRQPYKYDSTVQTVSSTEQVLIKTDFKNKVAGSSVENPNVFRTSTSSTLSPPGSGVEVGQASLDLIKALDGQTTAAGGTSANGGISQQIFSFDLIRAVEDFTGESIGATTADKVNWLKSNVKKLTSDWWGFGSGPSGNMATFAFWRTDISAWQGGPTTINGSVTKLSFESTSINLRIDDNGFMYVLSYANASDGITPSSIRTDYIDLSITTELPVLTVNNAGAKNNNFLVEATFTGAASEYKIEKGGTGEFIRVIFNFVATDILEIDFGKRKITINGVVQMPSLDLASAWFDLDSGETELIIANDTSASTELTYKTRYV